LTLRTFLGAQGRKKGEPLEIHRGGGSAPACFSARFQDIRTRNADADPDEIQHIAG